MGILKKNTAESAGYITQTPNPRQENSCFFFNSYCKLREAKSIKHLTYIKLTDSYNE